MNAPVVAGLLRFTFDGRELPRLTEESRCGSCGMTTWDGAEWHPYEACEVYERTHDSREVWRALQRRIVAGDAPWQRSGLRPGPNERALVRGEETP